MPETFNWDGYWKGTVEGGPMNANGSVARLDSLDTFISDVGAPASFADIGCGEARAVAHVAETHTETTVKGYDISPTVIEQNRADYDLPNLSFGVAELPSPNINHQFEMVHCYVTLHYVREIEQAVEDLYDLVESGGHLVVSYPNDATEQVYGEGIDEGTPLRKRFQIVCDGVNTISQQRIGELLDAPVFDYWEWTDAPDEASGPDGCNPCSVVTKPTE